MKKTFFNSGTKNTAVSAAVLLLRLVLGSMMIIVHGWPKLMNYTTLSETFYDPFGFGSAISLGLVVFAEFLASIFILIGLATRPFLIPLIITMMVIIFDVKWGQPLVEMEKAILFLAGFVVIFLTGAGNYSVDKMIR